MPDLALKAPAGKTSVAETDVFKRIQAAAASSIQQKCHALVI